MENFAQISDFELKESKNNRSIAFSCCHILSLYILREGFGKQSRSSRESSERASLSYRQRFNRCSGAVRVPPEQTTWFAEQQLILSRSAAERFPNASRSSLHAFSRNRFIVHSGFKSIHSAFKRVHNSLLLPFSPTFVRYARV